jgi:hypothetical protein
MEPKKYEARLTDKGVKRIDVDVEQGPHALMAIACSSAWANIVISSISHFPFNKKSQCSFTMPHPHI